MSTKLAVTTAVALLLFAHPAWAANPHDQVRGGGQVEFACPGNPMTTGFQTISIQAHVDAGTMTDGVKGQFNSTIPEGQCVPAGQLRVDIDCLRVIGNHADLTGRITKLTGFFTDPGFGFTEGGGIFISTTDLSPLLPDTIGARSPRSNTSCDFRNPREQPLARGNIQIDDAS